MEWNSVKDGESRFSGSYTWVWALKHGHVYHLYMFYVEFCTIARVGNALTIFRVGRFINPKKPPKGNRLLVFLVDGCTIEIFYFIFRRIVVTPIG